MWSDNDWPNKDKKADVIFNKLIGFVIYLNHLIFDSLKFYKENDDRENTNSCDSILVCFRYW